MRRIWRRWLVTYWAQAAGFISILVSVIVCSFLWAISYSPIPSSEPKTQHNYAAPNTEQKSPEANQSGTKRVPLAVQIVSPDEKTPEADREEQERRQKAANERGLTVATWTLAFATALLFVTASIQAGLFVWQLRLMGRGMRDATMAANAARQSAEATTLATRASVAVELPIIYSRIELFTIDPLVIQGDPFTKPVLAYFPPKDARLIIRFHNFGRTPARAERYCIMRVVTYELPPEPGYSSALLPSGTVIEPGQDLDADYFRRAIGLTDAERAMLTGAQADLWVYGMIQYRDFLGTLHTHRFCGRWYGAAPTEIGEGGEGFFFEDGPASYRTSD